jgi:hypothetical protein
MSMSKEPIIEPGIRGWLLVLTILLFVGPLQFMNYAHANARALDIPGVRSLTNPGHAAYDAQWAMLIFSETTGFQMLAMVPVLLLWPLFFLRHRFFRPVFAFVVTAVGAFFVFRAGLVAAIPAINQAYRSSIYLHTAVGLLVCVALVVYVLRSRRARLTFRYRLLFYPVFPFFIRA